MRYIDFFLIVSNFLTLTLLIILKHKINKQLKEIDSVRECLTKRKDVEHDYMQSLMTRLSDVQRTRFSNYFKNHGD